jgi:hypothetical protein
MCFRYGVWFDLTEVILGRGEGRRKGVVERKKRPSAAEDDIFER